MTRISDFGALNARPFSREQPNAVAESEYLVFWHGENSANEGILC